MLTLCPECNLRVSTKARTCPHCGYPFEMSAKSKLKPKKHYKLPNGFGGISELKDGYRRKPFRVRVTVGTDSKGRPIAKILGHFETYNDAYAALVEYNKNPYDLAPALTVAQVYEKWTEEHFKTLSSNASVRTIKSAWAYCSSVYDMRIRDVRARHIKGVIENGTANIKGVEKEASAGTKERIKSLFNLLFDYALEYELVDRNYARTFNLSEDIIEEKESAVRSHMIFTDEEMETLWKNITFPYVDVLLIQCYSGWRPQELGNIMLKDVDVKGWTFFGGMKTDAGRDRIVPIHSRIRGLVLARYNEAVKLGSDRLFNTPEAKNNILTYDKYRHRFLAIVEGLNLHDDHRAHDGRKHFVTLCKKYKVDEFAIKYMVGHAVSDITEKVYTERDVNWLKEEVEKIN